MHFAFLTALGQSPIHHAVVAGSFYPGTKDSLLKAIEECVRDAKKPPPIHTPPIGIIAPHAGYMYSGPVAATAYRAVEQGRYKTVVILGPSHFVPFDGIATTARGSWETPLGRVAVDHKRILRLMKRCSFIRDSAVLFAKEHSLEVQVPFIQRTMPSCRIVPLEFGTMTGEQYAALSEALADMIEEAPGEVLIVASSDLSHYHTDSQARAMDDVTLTNIVSGDLDRVVKDLNNRSSEMCGYSPVITLMLTADRLDAQPALLGYATTANATGDTTRVVGYSAVEYEVHLNPPTLPAEDKAELLAIARDAVTAAAQQAPAQVMSNTHRALDVKRGLFVTLTKQGELRGCIGSMRGTMPLWKAASDMGNSAACHDPRFLPLTQDEVKDIHIEISVLTPMVRIRPTDSIIIATHGLYIVDGASSGVLLPQVAVQFHWDRAEFLKQVCVKAGLPEDAWKKPGVKLYTFRAEVFGEK